MGPPPHNNSMSTTHVNLKPITLKNSKTFHDWQYTLKGALLKKLWPLVTGIKTTTSTYGET